ncbi:MAG TPA: ROK family protein [Pseudonocardiaceae bacterium]|nr:ROK family protein [Pseudonocardiaceae bacterium]
MTGRRLRAGVDIGGTKTLAVLCVEGETDVLATATAPTPAKAGGESILDIAAALVRAVSGRVDGEVVGIGVGAAGVIYPDDGMVVATGNAFDGWAGTAINAGLSARLDGAPVRADNDVNAFLIGELAAAGNPRHALAVTVGTGVGGALYVDGRLLHGGPTGAGEIGHVGDFGEERCSCGRTGHLEAYTSGAALTRRYARAGGVVVPDASAVADAATHGDPVAIEVFEQAGHHLGSAIAQAGGLLGIDLAIVGGGVLRAWTLLEKPLLAAVQAQPLLSGEPVTIRRSALGPVAVAIGATRLLG